MIKRLLIFLSLFLAFYSNAQQKTPTLIVYSDFVNPRSVYDSIVNNVVNQKLVDSVRIVGMPLGDKMTEIQMDSLRMKIFGITENMVWEKIATADNPDNVGELSQIKITTASEEEVPLLSFTTFRYISTFYRPEIFLQNPAIFFYKSRRAVKVVFYCKPESIVRLVNFIQQNMDKFSDSGIKTEFEFLN